MKTTLKTKLDKINEVINKWSSGESDSWQSKVLYGGGICISEDKEILLDIEYWSCPDEVSKKHQDKATDLILNEVINQSFDYEKIGDGNGDGSIIDCYEIKISDQDLISELNNNKIGYENH